MMLPPNIMKCVAFIGISNGSIESLVGTAFFVEIPVEDTQGKQTASYLVTAYHNIWGTNDTTKVPFVRLHKSDGELTQINIPFSKWKTHPTNFGVDVAVTPFNCEGHDHGGYPAVATQETIKKEGIGPGDNVAILGLFSRLVGKKQNIPIVRIGNVAAMPQEEIGLKISESGCTKFVESYLIECRSIGGLSGSPVFVEPRDQKYYYLFGLIHGHYDDDEMGIDHQTEVIEDRLSGKSPRINMGIAVVVPAKFIREVLDIPEFKEQRKTQRKEWLDKMAPKY